MHILKRIIKQGLDSVTRKIVEEAAVTHPAAMWTRIHNHCVVSTEHTSQQLLNLWKGLRISDYGTIGEYRAAETNLVDKFINAKLAHMVDEKARVTKVIQTLPTHTDAHLAMAFLINNNIQKMAEVWDILVRWENVQGPAFLAKNSNNAMNTPGHSTMSSFATSTQTRFNRDKNAVGNWKQQGPNLRPNNKLNRVTKPNSTTPNFCEYCKSMGYTFGNHTTAACRRKPHKGNDTLPAERTCMFCPDMTNHETDNCFKLLNYKKAKQATEQNAPTRKSIHTVNVDGTDAVMHINFDMAELDINNVAVLDTGAQSTIFNKPEYFNYITRCKIEVSTVCKNFQVRKLEVKSVYLFFCQEFSQCFENLDQTFLLYFPSSQNSNTVIILTYVF